jgi:glycosyltransferase involved in cell wall biosynthesis
VNVLYIQNSYPAASFVMTELYELDRRGHNVAVFANNEPDGIVHEEADGLDIPVGHASSFGPIEGVHSLPDFIGRTALERDVGFPFGLLRTHRAAECVSFTESLSFEIDRVHAHFPVKGNLHAIDVAEQLGVPMTTTAHAFGIFTDGLSETASKMFDAASRILVISEYNRTYLQDVYGVEKPIDLVPTMIRMDKFDPGDADPKPKRLLTVGRLVPKKGHIYAVDAVAKLAEDYPEIKYHIVGDGAEEDRLRSRISDRGVEENVELLGRVSDDRLRREFEEAAIFVLPCVIDETGDRDGIPVVLKEAMAMRTVCVSTYVSGIPELIEDGETGLLVPERDVASLHEAMDSLLNMPESRQLMSNSARKSIEASQRSPDETLDIVTSFMSTVD